MIEFITGIVIGALLVLFNLRRRVKKNEAEVSVSSALRRHFSGDDYHLIDNVTLSNNDTTTQIDHILVSHYGIFVIETKKYNGWIFGKETDKRWTQVLFTAKFRFVNPVRQNAGHVAVLRDLFKLDPSVFHSAVVFCGHPEFKTSVPTNVFLISDLIGHIESH